MYLYIFEDQSMWQQNEEPNNSDLDSIAAGILMVIKFEELGENFMELIGDAEYKTIKIRKP